MVLPPRPRRTLPAPSYPALALLSVGLNACNGLVVPESTDSGTAGDDSGAAGASNATGTGASGSAGVGGVVGSGGINGGQSVPFPVGAQGVPPPLDSPYFNPSYRPPPAVAPGFVVSGGGYVTSGPWQGYAWTDTELPSLGSAISPADFSAVAQAPLCVSGTVGADPAYGSFAMLGVYLNMPPDGGAGSALPWVPTGSGISYSGTNSGGSTLRLQLIGASGAPEDNWCALLAATSGSIPWSSFNTRCWDGSGTAYDAHVPLKAVAIVVPGAPSAIPFDFCLLGLSPD